MAVFCLRVLEKHGHFYFYKGKLLSKINIKKSLIFHAISIFIIKYTNTKKQDVYKFVISGIKNGKILQELDLDAKKENIVSYKYKNNAIYIVKKDRVYKLKWNSGKMAKLIDLQNHWINIGKSL